MKMTSKTVYIAYDDEEFEDINECIQHEQFAIDMMNDLIGCVTFLDEHGTIMSFTNEIEIDVRIDDFYHQWERCTYIVIKEDVPSSAVTFICNFCGIIMPEEKGKYYYDFDAGEWKRCKAA